MIARQFSVLASRLRGAGVLPCVVSGVISCVVSGLALAAEPGQSTVLEQPSFSISNPDPLEPDDLTLVSPADASPGGAGVHLSKLRLGQASGDWLALIRQHVPELAASAEAQSLTPGLVKKIRSDISAILATEGYFSPLIRFQKQANNTSEVLVNIDAGQRTLVQDLDVKFSGALADAANAGQAAAVARRDNLIANWPLTKNTVFRDDDWVSAKNALLDNLRSETYASASINYSQANIDAENYSATLELDVDSGPPFTLGDMTVTGLQRYPAWLLERYNPPKKGEPYSRARLLEYQRLLQNSAYFSTVSISVDADASKADAVPLDVNVVERRARDLAFGSGYSSNTGFRVEVSYRDRHLFDKAWDLRSAVRLEQKRQLGYADIYLPPRVSNHVDSVGVLFDKLDVSGVLSTRNAIGFKRTSTFGHLEQRLGLNLAREKVDVSGVTERISKALVGTVGWTWRNVDNSFAPRKGYIAQTDFALSEKALISDQRFFRMYGKYQHWLPVGASDSIILRAEAGQLASRGADGIPEDYLFRTGGSTTVRGYAYQSLGKQLSGATVGGRVMAAASAEYVHWLNASWGSAVFVDMGDAAATWRDYSARQSYGTGARYNTPAGPIALDLAYARQTKKVRLDFSIAIAF
ncbi:autotransporter assembly complex family protein [soil metagenome]